MSFWFEFPAKSMSTVTSPGGFEMNVADPTKQLLIKIERFSEFFGKEYKYGVGTRIFFICNLTEITALVDY